MKAAENNLKKLLNREAPGWVCSLWVTIELMALRFCAGLVLWRCIGDTLDCLNKELWSGFVILLSIDFYLLLVLALTLIRTRRSRIFLGALVIASPLCFWLGIDCFILRADSVEDLAAGLLMQLSAPILFSLALYLDPTLKSYFDSKKFNWLGFQKK